MSRPGKCACRLRVYCGSVFLIAVLAASANDVSRTLSEFVCYSWQREEGLPDNSVQTILQTREGYLWLGTARGLVRFDGARFVLFDRANTPELRNDSVTSLAEDNE